MNIRDSLILIKLLYKYNKKQQYQMTLVSSNILLCLICSIKPKLKDFESVLGLLKSGYIICNIIVLPVSIITVLLYL